MDVEIALLLWSTRAVFKTDISFCWKMICAKCNAHFCYRCGAKLDESNAYDHFKAPGTRCYSKLFEFEDEENEQQPLEEFDAVVE